MVRDAASCVLGLSLMAGCAGAEMVWTSYTVTLTLQQAGVMDRVHHHPNVVKFYGMAQVQLTPATTSDGKVMNNPLYEETKTAGANPLFQGSGDRRTPGTWTQFESHHFDQVEGSWTSLGSSYRDGIVHRDLAVRNVLLSSSRGVFRSLLGEQFTLGSDGPLDLRSATKELPIRWSAPEVLRLYLDGDEGTDAYFEASAALELAVIPSPAAAALLVAAGLVSVRRRR